MNIKSILLALTLPCAALPICASATIFKCGDAAHVIYQDTPCKKGQPSQLLSASLRANPASDELQTDLANNEDYPLNETRRLASRDPRLILGMLDTQVLNLRGWGRPAKIKRTKLHRAWREEWIYQSPQEGERQLEFVNGKLASVM